VPRPARTRPPGHAGGGRRCRLPRAASAAARHVRSTVPPLGASSIARHASLAAPAAAAARAPARRCGRPGGSRPRPTDPRASPRVPDPPPPRHSDPLEGQLEFDLGNLAAFDPAPVDAAAYAHPQRDAACLAAAAAMAQALVAKLFALPSEPVTGGRLAQLPAPATPLPREKPVPKVKALTKWQQFAQKKGIVKRKRSKLAWDEDAGEWKRRHGYKKANDDEAVPIIEARPGDEVGAEAGARPGGRGQAGGRQGLRARAAPPPVARGTGSPVRRGSGGGRSGRPCLPLPDPSGIPRPARPQVGEDPFSKLRQEKRARVKKNSEQQLANLKEAAKSGAALPPTLRLAAALPEKGRGKPTKRKELKNEVRGRPAGGGRRAGRLGRGGLLRGRLRVGCCFRFGVSQKGLPSHPVGAAAPATATPRPTSAPVPRLIPPLRAPPHPIRPAPPPPPASPRHRRSRARRASRASPPRARGSSTSACRARRTASARCRASGARCSR
jgi:hypothetical protein